MFILAQIGRLTLHAHPFELELNKSLIDPIQNLYRKIKDSRRVKSTISKQLNYHDCTCNPKNQKSDPLNSNKSDSLHTLPLCTEPLPTHELLHQEGLLTIHAHRFELDLHNNFNVPVHPFYRQIQDTTGGTRTISKPVPHGRQPN